MYCIVLVGMGVFRNATLSFLNVFFCLFAECFCVCGFFMSDNYHMWSYTEHLHLNKNIPQKKRVQLISPVVKKIPSLVSSLVFYMD